MQKPLILPCRGIEPAIDAQCWIAPNATIVGDVTIGTNSSVWFQAVIRGDVAPIRIGQRVNVQDGAVVHGTFEKSETTIEDEASIGHNAIVHGAHIGKSALIGMGAVVMDHAVIGEEAVVAAGAVVLAGTIVPKGRLWAGVPAKDCGVVKPDLRQSLKATAQRYVKYADWFR
jgi:carbonic anhydrase/acetyltransferase-like protein (isoleucine patch superfamily)